jgi:hypothetical protein
VTRTGAAGPGPAACQLEWRTRGSPPGAGDLNLKLRATRTVSARAASSHCDHHGVQAGKPRLLNAAAWARRLLRAPPSRPAGDSDSDSGGLGRGPRAAAPGGEPTRSTDGGAAAPCSRHGSDGSVITFVDVT